MCRVHFHQATLGKSNQKLERHKYPSLRKSYSTSRKGIDGREKKEKISKSKTTTLTYFLII